MFILAYIVVIALAAGHLYISYPQLPELLATHFNNQGTPNGWMTRNAFVVFELAFQTVVPGLFFISGLLVEKHPNMVNIPHRDYWLAPERRAESVAALRRMLAAYGLLCGLFFIAVCQFLIDTNRHQPPVANSALIISMVAGFSVVTLFFVIWCYRRFPKPAA